MTEGVYTLPQRMRLAVVGSREWESTEHLRRAGAMIAYAYGLYRPSLVISGGARGIDKLAETFARWLRIPTSIHHAPRDAVRWEDFEPRNTEIAQNCTHMLCIVSPVSKTRGSQGTADIAQRLNRPVHRILMAPGERMPDWPDWSME